MKRNFIVKSNALIEARYRLSLQESHVILWLLTQIQPDDEDFKEHKLEITEFSKMAGTKADNQYHELRAVTKRLIQRAMEIYSHEEDKTIQVAWLSSAEYHHRKGYVSLEFSPKLKPYLLQLKKCFTKIDIVDTLKLKSIYAVRVFELLLQYISVGKREINIDDLRSYCGIEKNQYPLYGSLKAKVIDRAKFEINAKTEYKIDYKEKKKSRKVIGLEWNIEKKTHFEKAQESKIFKIKDEIDSNNPINSLVKYGISTTQAKKIIKQEELETITNAIKVVEERLAKGNVKNPAGMISEAIKNRWKI